MFSKHLMMMMMMRMMIANHLLIDSVDVVVIGSSSVLRRTVLIIAIQKDWKDGELCLPHSRRKFVNESIFSRGSIRSEGER